MQIKTIIQEIQRLPLDKRFFVIEQTLKSIKNEELKTQLIAEFFNDTSENKNQLSTVLVNEKSLAKDWASDEDSRWDNLL
ncbi:MAG: hypothetical protein RL711_1982 [Bacteroidota bacterium]|jgi:hypothetical protein